MLRALSIVLALTLVRLAFATGAAPAWEQRSPSPETRGLRFLYQAPVSLGSRLYIVQRSVLEYDPARDVWNDLRVPRPEPRYHHATAALAGKIYVIAGSVRGGPSDWLSTVEEFDLVTRAWRTRAPMPGPRRNTGAAVVDDHIFVLGGEGAEPRAMPIVRYDPHTDTWTQMRAATRVRQCWGAQAIHGKIYILGNTGLEEPPDPVLDEYDPATDTITPRTPLPRSRMAFATAVVNGRLVVLGGSPGNNVPLAQVDIYDPAADAWSTGPDLPEPKCWLGAIALADQLYAIGGIAGDFSKPANVMYATDVTAFAPHQPSEMASATFRSTSGSGAQAATPDIMAQLFAPGVIPSPESGGITFTPDGNTAYFGAKTPGGKWGIHVSHLKDGRWSQPVVAPFSGEYQEGDPQVAPDGNRLFYFSCRPMDGKPKQDLSALWYVERLGDTWSEPRLVGANDDGSWNSLTLGCGTPSPAADGTLYFFRCTDRTGKQVRIVRSTPVGGRYRTFEDLGDTINGKDNGGFDVGVAPDQSFIVFSCAKRPDTHGRTDLYISYREGSDWSEPRNLGPKVNSAESEYSPTLSPDGKTLFFSRNGIRSIPLAACDGVRAGPAAKLFEEGLISTPDSFATAFTPDGRTLYFCRMAGEPSNRRSTIMVSHLNGPSWSAPQPVPFSGRFNDFDVSLSPDGSRLFFASIRPETGPRPTLWFVEQDAAGEWGTPKPLPAITGDDGSAVFPSVAANGNLYFAGHRTGLSEGDDDIYVCRRQADGSYAAPENLGPAINSPAQDYDGYVAPDESFIVFCSKRPGGISDSDFYISVRENGVWTPARNLGPKINSATSPGICCPAVSPDRKWFYFTSARDSRRGIYRIEFPALGLAASVTTASEGETVQRATDGVVAARLEPVLFGDGAVKGCSPTFSPDGETVFTHLYTETEGHTILVSHFRDGRWTESVVAPFSGVFDEMEPAFSHDGRRLIFASHRPVTGMPEVMRLWYVEQTDTGWSEPGLLPVPSQTASTPSGAPSIAQDGSLYFGQINDRGWPWTISCSRRDKGVYRAPENINDAVNPGGRSWSHSIAPDETFLVVAGVVDWQTPRADSLGDIDLYVSFRENGHWQRGINLGPVVNTVDAEVWPRISRDGRTLFFNRQGPNARGIYQIDLQRLLAPLRPLAHATPRECAAGCTATATGIESRQSTESSVAYPTQNYIRSGVACLTDATREDYAHESKGF